jgi:hypothetical protein
MESGKVQSYQRSHTKEDYTVKEAQAPLPPPFGPKTKISEGLK